MDQPVYEIKAVSNPIQDQRKEPQSPKQEQQEPEVKQPISYEL